MTQCKFCQIIQKDSSSVSIFEDKVFFAFLDIRPLFHGHTLLVPKDHYETFYDLPQQLISPFFSHAQRLGTAIEHGLEAKGSFIAMNNRISQSVPHLHLHIVPRNPQDGLKGFFLAPPSI